jgi:stage II sporulation protein D
MEFLVRGNDGNVWVYDDLDEYLRGVGEVPALWEPAVVQAQMVAARSYAAFAYEHPRHDDCHLCARPHCQSWGNRHHYARDRAIEATRGLVLYYVGPSPPRGSRSPIVCQTFYSARCGGRTGTRDEETGIWVPVWNPPAAPWCKIVECPCPVLPGWQGETTQRHGHGIGLCQWGARVLARRGYTFRQILQHYFADFALGIYGQGPSCPEKPGQDIEHTDPGGDR